MWSSFLVNLQVCTLIAHNFTIKWTPLETFFATILKAPMLPPCIDLSWGRGGRVSHSGGGIGGRPHLTIFSEKPPIKIDAPPMGWPPPLQNKALRPIWKTKRPHWNVKHSSIKWFLEKAPLMYWIKPLHQILKAFPNGVAQYPHVLNTCGKPCNGEGERHIPPYVLKTCGKPCLFGHAQTWSLVKQLNTIPVFLIKSAT